MRRLVTICAVLGLILVPACVSWANLTVNSPPGAPTWWNSACPYYAYGWWEVDIPVPGGPVSPPNDPTHWATNFLVNTDFTASVGGANNETISVYLKNGYRADYYKEIYVYIDGRTNSNPLNVVTVLDTDSGTFSGSQTWNIKSNGEWNFVLDGEIHPQPDFVSLTFTVPGMTSVANVWAGENCVPVPGAVLLGFLGLSAAGIKLRKFA